VPHDKASLNRLQSLYRGWSAPVIRALYERDLTAARAAFAEANARLARQPLSADEACAAACLLAALDYTITRALGLAAEQAPAFAALLERLQDTEPVGETSQTVRRALLLAHRIRGERAGYGALEPNEFHTLFNFIPTEARDLELWHQAASWAFLHDDSALLERAYEVFVVQPSGFASQYPFHRVKLMHAILQGRVAKAELASYCTRLATLNEVHETRHLLWPRLRALDLVDRELEQLLDAAELRITAQPPSAPG
jgi:hypothetical protein